jgi:DNA-binding transcriptional LysR family regulator
VDLNDLRYFATIVDRGGFTAAERETRVSKSKLSRRVALLEERLGVRLLQRSTRRLALTEAGRAFYEHCAAMMVEAQAAHQAVEQLRSEPAGTVRMTCPVVMAQFGLPALLADFMALHPKVRVLLDSADRIVNLLDERIDIALRARDAGLADPSLTARKVTTGRLVLVASPAFVASMPAIDTPERLSDVATIGSVRGGEQQTWSLFAADGRIARVTHQPRFMCSDFGVQVQAATRGVGVAFVPLRAASRGFEDGSLARVASEWGSAEEDIHLVFATRRGMLPSVRALIDYLMQHLPEALIE